MVQKCVVIHETDAGFIECVGAYDDEMTAYGKAYTTLSDAAFDYTQSYDDKYYISTLSPSEGECGYIMQLVNKETSKVEDWAIVLFYEPEDGEGEAKT